MDERFSKFGKLEEVAGYFAQEAFQYAHYAAHYEVADILFGERLKSMALNEYARPEPFAPQDFDEFISKRDSAGVSDLVSATLAGAWHQSQENAWSTGLKLSRSQKFDSQHIMAHVMLLSTCIEMVVNRRLFQLRSSNILPAHLYSSLERADLLAKVAFMLRDEVLSGRLNTTNLKQLVALRNQAVHYKESSIGKITPTAEALLSIWREVGQLFALVPGEPTQGYMEAMTAGFCQRWLEPTSSDKAIR